MRGRRPWLASSRVLTPRAPRRARTCGARRAPNQRAHARYGRWTTRRRQSRAQGVPAGPLASCALRHEQCQDFCSDQNILNPNLNRRATATGRAQKAAAACRRSGGARAPRRAAPRTPRRMPAKQRRSSPRSSKSSTSRVSAPWHLQLAPSRTPCASVTACCRNAGQPAAETGVLGAREDETQHSI